MDIEKDQAAIQALLLSCGISHIEQEELRPTPTRLKPTRVLKYIKFEDSYTKEYKYSLVLKDILKVVDVEFLLKAKTDGWLEITYTRQYKECEGGPVFNLYGEKKMRFAEVNSRFPIFNLLTELRKKYNEYIEQKQAA
jgi:hypothetical protein